MKNFAMESLHGHGIGQGAKIAYQFNKLTEEYIQIYPELKFGFQSGIESELYCEACGHRYKTMKNKFLVAGADPFSCYSENSMAVNQKFNSDAVVLADRYNIGMERISFRSISITNDGYVTPTDIMSIYAYGAERWDFVFKNNKKGRVDIISMHMILKLHTVEVIEPIFNEIGARGLVGRELTIPLGLITEIVFSD